jgi:hypothetical protein
MHRALWVIQVLVALFFGLASAAPKLFVPAEMLPPLSIPLAPAFILFIGIAEMAGALGLILPGLTGIRTGLTPLAAGGLVLVTIGATIYQLMAGEPGNAVFAIVLGAITAFVGYGRWKLAPHGATHRKAVLQAA